MYKHVLVATDLCDDECKIEEKAVKLAKLWKAKVSLVHTIEPIPAYGYPDLEELQSPFIDKAREEMAKLAKRLKVALEDQHIVFGPVKNKVLEVAEELGVDIITIGSHGRHGIGRLLGSGATSIVNGAHCDVLTIRCQTG